MPGCLQSRHATVHVWTVTGLAGVPVIPALTVMDLLYSFGPLLLCSVLRSPQSDQVGFTKRSTPLGLRTGPAPYSSLLAFVGPTALPGPHSLPYTAVHCRTPAVHIRIYILIIAVRLVRRRVATVPVYY